MGRSPADGIRYDSGNPRTSCMEIGLRAMRMDARFSALAQEGDEPVTRPPFCAKAPLSPEVFRKARPAALRLHTEPRSPPGRWTGSAAAGRLALACER